MRNFDEELDSTDDRTFVIGGETFTMPFVPPEVLAEYEDERAEELHRLREEAKEKGEDFYVPNDAADTVERMDARIKSFLRDEDHARYDSMRKRTGEQAVPYSALKALERWMVEVQSVRPTERPSRSEPGPGSTARSSSGRRPSREAVPA